MGRDVWNNKKTVVVHHGHINHRHLKSLESINMSSNEYHEIVGKKKQTHNILVVSVDKSRIGGDSIITFDRSQASLRTVFVSVLGSVR